MVNQEDITIDLPDRSPAGDKIRALRAELASEKERVEKMESVLISANNTAKRRGDQLIAERVKNAVLTTAIGIIVESFRQAEVTYGNSLWTTGAGYLLEPAAEAARGALDLSPTEELERVKRKLTIEVLEKLGCKGAANGYVECLRDDGMEEGSWCSRCKALDAAQKENNNVSN